MKMNPLTNDLLATLSTGHPHQQPQISLYLPTHRHLPENQQDPIRFLNLVKKLELLLQEDHAAEQVSSLLEPFEVLGRDADFWNHTLDGLAVFGSPGWFTVVGLQRTVPELTVVADSFHTKPLRQFLQSADRYQILGLNQHGIKLYEGNRDSLEELEPATGVPRTIDEALGVELTRPHRTVASYGGVGATSSPMHHGHGGKTEEVDKDADRFFRAVDRRVLEAHSRPSGLPLILAALPEHHHRFHQISHNPFLVPGGIKMHPDSLPIGALRASAWEIVEPLYHARLTALADDFAAAKSKGLGLDELHEIAGAAAAGRIATLLIEADRGIAGRLDAETGKLQVTAASQPGTDDLLDDLGEMVSGKGGDVVVLPSELMPVKTGAAATCRF